MLLERPEPITVIAMTPDGPPSWFRWRGMEQRIVTSTGPERIAGEWWRGRHEGTEARRHEVKTASKGESYARAYGRFMLGREYCPPTSRVLAPKPQAPSPKPSPTRDYFKIQDERGRWLWIYRVLESGRWFVHGLWA